MILFGFNLAGVLPMICANIIFIKYFRRVDSFHSRQSLIMANGLMIIAQMFQYFGVVFGILFTDKMPVNALAFNFSVNALQVMSYSYLLFVCQQWAALYQQSNVLGQGVSDLEQIRRRISDSKKQNNNNLGGLQPGDLR